MSSVPMLSPYCWRGYVMKELAMQQYKVKVVDLKGLKDISDLQIETHLELYVGYVRNTNALNEQLAELVRDGKAGTPAYSELTRRLGFEYNGMRLHELYFENLTPDHRPLDATSVLHAELARHFRTFEAWRRDFAAVASMRGVGWAIL